MSAQEWTKITGWGAPAYSLVADAVVASIKGGNLSGKIDVLVNPYSWERCVFQFGEHRPVEFEQFENKAVLVTFVCGRKVRIFSDPSVEGPDEARYRASP